MKHSNIWATTALALSLVAGGASAQQNTPGAYTLGSGPSAGRTRLLQAPDVQKELKLTGKQVQEIQKVRSSLQQEMHTWIQQFRRLPKEKQTNGRGAMLAFMERQDQRVLKVLDDKQRQRLKQIQVQEEGPRALVRPEIGEELNLSKEQKKKVTDLLDEERETWVKVVQGKAGINLSDPRLVKEKLAQVRKGTDDRILGLLSSSQKSRYTALQGTPFRAAN